MSAAAKILERLQRVKQTRPDRWIACCPAHEDKSPSLSLREMPDGRVLIYDFGGCSTEAVMEAIGLTLGDLWNKPLDHCLSPVRRGFSAREVIEMTSHEAMVAAELAVTARERALTDEESARLEQAASRLLTAQTLTQ